MFDTKDLVPIVLFSGLFIMIIMISYFLNRRKERMALIESGLNANIFERKEKKPQLAQSLKLGIVGFFMGIGLLIGDFIKNNSQINDAVSYLSMLLIFGGLGLLSFYIVQSKMKTNE